MSMRVGFYANDFNWAGGIDFIYYLYKGLSKTKNKYIFYLILYDESKRSPLYKPYLVIKLLVKFLMGRLLYETLILNLRNVISRRNNDSIYTKTSLLDQYLDVFKGEKIEILSYGEGSYSLDKVLKKNKIDIIFPVLNSAFEKQYFIPHIGYIFDFTHRYNPTFYSAEHYLQSDINFAKTLLKSDVLIVNSQSVKADINRFYPTSKNKVFDLPFTPFINEQLVKEADLLKGDILNIYKINQPFFIICNQLWPHKNHEVALRALAIVIQQFRDIKIIFTGSKIDLSGTEARYLELINYAKSLGVEENVCFLGHIDKIHQIALVKASIGLIQPTTFEGGPGGGSVYLALALNKSCIVSDIPINREIVDFLNLSFFNPYDEQMLAKEMISLLTQQSTQGEIEDSSKTPLYEERLEKLGSRLEETILCAISMHKQKNA